jgi:hypothetical protein
MSSARCEAKTQGKGQHGAVTRALYGARGPKDPQEEEGAWFEDSCVCKDVGGKAPWIPNQLCRVYTQEGLGLR